MSSLEFGKVTSSPKDIFMKHFRRQLDIATFIHVAQSGKEQKTYTD